MRVDMRALPRRATLEALARGLGMSYEMVRRVAAQTAYGETAPPSLRHGSRSVLIALVGYCDELSDDQVEVLLAAARVMHTHAV
jgi:hypothetical protein